jgi:hypothetical protein
MAVLFGAIGAALLAVALDEGIRALVMAAVMFLGVSGALLVWLVGRVARAALGRSRELARDTVATPRRRRIMIRVGIVFGIFLMFVIYNWIVWYGIHRECTLAWDAEDRNVAQEHILRAAEAADNPLLLLPSDLFDLHGPGRCRSAASEHGIPRPD